MSTIINNHRVGDTQIHVDVGDYTVSDILTLTEPSGDIELSLAAKVGTCAFITRKITGIKSNSVTSIGQSAFYGCSKLTYASFRNVTSISSSAFQNCSSLATVYFPKATFIGSSAFQSCSSLVSCSFPKVTTIGDSSFCSCISLSEVNFDNVVTISANAFKGCTSLLNFSASKATTIGNTSFNGCSSLITAAFPKLTTMGGGTTFNGCGSLQTLDLGVTGRLMGTNQFSGNNGMLSTLILRKSNGVATMDGVGFFNYTAFASNGSGGTIYIPEVMYNHLNDNTGYDYMKVTNWIAVYSYGNLTWSKIEGSAYDYD